ncbi:hypothetical protein DL546_007024 [Coniochaeta pulveracea]|uniref:TLC domain-containing protein n=1 Tax=Coniochaeta pulveracea TaxID=177199 RepID=A0A420Y8G6_9PEZI|nr:hypothetical protein DL546_007024 [Coniochaeta pulveracea]
MAEPFPEFNTGADFPPSPNAAPRRRRASSRLGDDVQVGDTGAPALATSFGHEHQKANGSANHQLSSAQAKKAGTRRRDRPFHKRVLSYAKRHTWTVPLAILLTFGLLYALNPSESNPVHHFIFLSYKLPQPDPSVPAQYGKGKWDFAFFSFYTIVLSFTREFIMQQVLRPWARHAGIRSRGKQARFMEQTYTALYFGVMGPVGMYVMSQTPVWYFSTYGLYEGYPHKSHIAVFKFYYLFQAAYWAQQALVMLLGLEKPRKDFKELIGHHVVSLALIFLSYRFHFTYMGLAVYVTHDISDFFLASSKTLNYLDHPITGPYFFIFMCVWIYMRHYLNLRIIYSLFTEYRTVGPYELNWETQEYKCWIALYITFFLLAALQSLNLFWLFFIIRIAYRFVVHHTANDDRSDDEESEGEEGEEKKGLKEEKGMEKPQLLVTGTDDKVEVVDGPSFAEVAASGVTSNGSAKKRGKK